ncbi:MAG: hypothetical protein ABSB97_00340 [Thermoplasmata archaeon]
MCTYTTTDTSAQGYSFSKWTVSGDAFYGEKGAGTLGNPFACNNLNSDTNTTNPISPFCMSVPVTSGTYDGFLTATVS